MNCIIKNNSWSRGVASGGPGWSMSRASNDQGGPQTKWTLKNPHWFGGPSLFFVHAPRGSCYACELKTTGWTRQCVVLTSERHLLCLRTSCQCKTCFAPSRGTDCLPGTALSHSRTRPPATSGKQTNKQSNKQTNKQTVKQTNKQSNKQTNSQTNKQSNKQTNSQTNKQTVKQTNKQSNKQTKNKTKNKQTKTPPSPPPKKERKKKNPPNNKHKQIKWNKAVTSILSNTVQRD